MKYYGDSDEEDERMYDEDEDGEEKEKEYDPSGEDEWLKEQYDDEKHAELKKSETDKRIFTYCSICGYRDVYDYFDESEKTEKEIAEYDNGWAHVMPKLLYRMKFPFGIVIPQGLTAKDQLCPKCLGWIDIIFKLQDRVGRKIESTKKEENKEELIKKKEMEKFLDYNKHCSILNELIEVKLDLINELRKELRKLKGVKSSPNKEKLKKEFVDVSNKIEKLEKKYGFRSGWSPQ